MTKRTERGRGAVRTLTLFLKRRDRRLAKLFLAGGVVLLALLAWSVWPYWELSGRFESIPAEAPSRLYGRPFRLAPGAPLAAPELIQRLEALAYRPAGEAGLVPGTFRATAERVAIARRRVRAAVGDGGGGLLVVELRAGRVAQLLVDERPAAESFLDPPLLATFYGPELRERRPVAVADIPADAVRAVLAAEDAAFFEHPGISLGGIVRALWTNLRAGELKQGGSTITQQLAKNLYLTHERKLSRKLREALLTVMLELRYSKEQILEAYLNQIFWGRSGAANLMGIGAAAWAICGKPVGELELADGALLAGMIRAPASYAPATRPDAARARRDGVLDRMAELDWIPRAAAEAAKSRPLPKPPPPATRRAAPYFADAAAAEVRRRFGIADLADSGHAVFGTLDLADQERAEEAVAWGLAELAERSERVRKKGEIFQAALVSIEPGSGAVRAYVGGRDYRESQFDRAGQARRQAGSAFKPIVYAAAFERGVATPATLLEDAPLRLVSGGEEWAPANDDDEYRGWVTARTAIEKSLNVPTVRLALSTGLDEVVATARAVGIQARLRPFPAVALGAFEVSPLDLATAYATLANRGVRPSVHLVDGVAGPDGKPLAGAPLPPPKVALSPQTAYLVTALLQGVVDYGTGAQIRALGLADPVAGKTGTTNRKRDSWFAGYSPERATVVWVGFDDDTPTPFSGRTGALPLWTRFTLAARPPGGYARPQPPSGVRVVLIDPATGELATDRCPEVLAEAFRDDRVPAGVCHLHGGWRAQPIDPGIRAERDREQGSLRDWLRRLFGRDRRTPPPPRRGPSDEPPP
jgi:penicillin-binding protein 1B